jgi:hypothetical protein
VFTSGGRFLDHVGVGVGARTDDDGLNIGIVHNDAMIPGGRGDVEVGGALLSRLQDDVGDSQKIGLGYAEGQMFGVEPSDPPCADKPNVDFRRHHSTPPSILRNTHHASRAPCYMLRI